MAKTKVEKTEVIQPKVEKIKTMSEPFDYELFFENNKKVIVSVVGGLAVLAAVFFGGKYYLQSQNAEAQEKMFQAEYYFKADSLDLALKGKGKDMGFLSIKEEYPYTDAANISSFYAGVIYMNKGDFKNAIAQLNEFSSNDVLYQGRAYALIGDAYLEQNNFNDAKAYYLKAAEYKPNKDFTPGYLNKLAIAAEKSKDYQTAMDAYDKIMKEYPTSPQANEAKKYKAYLEEVSAK